MGESELKLNPIGVIHTPYEKDKEIPHQAYKSEDVGEVFLYLSRKVCG